MKFSVVLFFIGVCLVAANAHHSSSLENDSLAKDYVEIDTHSVWTNLALVIRKTLKIIRGVKCTVKEVVEVQEAALKFLNDVESCKKNVTGNVQALIDVCKTIVALSNDIIHANEKICGNTQEASDSDDNRTSKKCYKLLLDKTLELKDQVKDAIDLMKIVIELPDETSKCATTAVKDLERVFILFPVKIEYCSSLLH